MCHVGLKEQLQQECIDIDTYIYTLVDTHKNRGTHAHAHMYEYIRQLLTYMSFEALGFEQLFEDKKYSLFYAKRDIYITIYAFY